MNLFDSNNRLFVLARQAKRLPHIALAIPLTFAIVLVGQIAGGLPMVLLLRWLVPQGSAGLSQQPTLYGAGTALFLIGAFGLIFVLLWAWLWAFEKRPFWTLGFERAGAFMQYLRGLGLGVAMFALGLAALAAMGWVAPERGGEAYEGWAAVGGVLLVAIGWAVQGAAEETLTRGWLMGVVGARYRPWLGVLVASLVFTLLHGLNPNIAPLPLLNLFLFAVFAALYALWDGSLWGIAAWHAAWNWAQGNLFGLQVSGNTDGGPILWNLQEAGPDLITGGAFGPEGGLAVTGMLVIGIAIVGARLWAKRQRATAGA